MPLLTASNSHIDTVYLTADGTNTGAPARVFWQDWSSRTKKVKTPSYGLDGTPYLTNTGVGSKGLVTLIIPWCSSTLYGLLKAQANTTTHYAAVFYHAQLGTKSITVEVIDVIAPADEQWRSGDPVENVTVRLMSYGDTP